LNSPADLPPTVYVCNACLLNAALEGKVIVVICISMYRYEISE
jgi:hypothetical protein